MGAKEFNLKRIIVAGLILPVLVAYIYLLPKYFFLILLIIVAMVATGEIAIMYRVPARLYIPGILTTGIVLYIFSMHEKYILEAIFLGMMSILVLRLILINNPSGSMFHIGSLGLGIFYIAGFLSFQWYIRTYEEGVKYIFLLYTSVWLADTFAYYIGTYLGNHKLYPSVSPAKTVEGAGGSIIGGAIGAIMIKSLLGINSISLVFTLIIGALLGLGTIVGDLIESMIKRDAGVKDSSALLPAHGGILDKIDGLLVSGPILYILMRYL